MALKCQPGQVSIALHLHEHVERVCRAYLNCDACRSQLLTLTCHLIVQQMIYKLDMILRDLTSWDPASVVGRGKEKDRLCVADISIGNTEIVSADLRLTIATGILRGILTKSRELLGEFRVLKKGSA